MKFELLPTLDFMFELYQKPANSERFNEYIKILQGKSKGDLLMPIGGFNPMAKGHIIEKILELKSLNAEQICKEVLAKINQKYDSHKNKNVFKVAINLSDDLKGGWTNRFTTDFDNKFKLNALVSRQFCTPIFWSSEEFSRILIENRVTEAVFRTIYWLENPKPKILKEYLEQEKFVAKHINSKHFENDFEVSELFFKQYQYSEDYSIIFNFFYGDAASKSLGFATYGNKASGFDYSKYLIQKIILS